MLYRCRHTADSHLSKVTHPPAFGAPVRFTAVQLRGDLWRQKTRVTGLLCGSGIVNVIVRVAVLVEHRLVTDRQTDRHVASIASRGKNCSQRFSQAFNIC